MPRPAKIWRKAQNGDYYATINGKQERLGPDYKKALEQFNHLKATVKDVSTPLQRNLTLGRARDLFLNRCAEECSPRTHENRSIYRVLRLASTGVISNQRNRSRAGSES
jgi:hypothetical protein